MIKKIFFHTILRLNKIFFKFFNKSQKEYLVSSLGYSNNNSLTLDIDNNELFNSIIKKFDNKILRKENYGNLVSLFTTFECINYIVKKNLLGDIIESGVANGRQVCLILETLKYYNKKNFNVYLYDTFQGMVEPGKYDYKTWEKDNSESIKKYNKSLNENKVSSWQNYSLEEVKKNISLTEYPENKINYVIGDVTLTIPNNKHETISFLRLDTDFYESTKVELDYLFSKVIKGGVIILDDYGAFTGVKKATDEFFDSHNLSPLLIRTSFKERVFIKL
tara:strand:+ start:233 stop:1063 length:831 start_codon:yes stop_codon:yes gene_type:complete